MSPLASRTLEVGDRSISFLPSFILSTFLILLCHIISIQPYLWYQVSISGIILTSVPHFVSSKCPQVLWSRSFIVIWAVDGVLGSLDIHRGCYLPTTATQRSVSWGHRQFLTRLPVYILHESRRQSCHCMFTPVPKVWHRGACWIGASPWLVERDGICFHGFFQDLSKIFSFWQSMTGWCDTSNVGHWAWYGYRSTTWIGQERTRNVCRLVTDYIAKYWWSNILRSKRWAFLFRLDSFHGMIFLQRANQERSHVLSDRTKCWDLLRWQVRLLRIWIGVDSD